jgi:hypothetical protein
MILEAYSLPVDRVGSLEKASFMLGLKRELIRHIVIPNPKRLFIVKLVNLPSKITSIEAYPDGSPTLQYLEADEGTVLPNGFGRVLYLTFLDYSGKCSSVSVNVTDSNSQKWTHRIQFTESPIHVYTFSKQVSNSLPHWESSKLSSSKKHYRFSKTVYTFNRIRYLGRSKIAIRVQGKEYQVVTSD